MKKNVHGCKSLCVISFIVILGVNAAEVADFTTGAGTDGWTISEGVYTSPVYSNAVDQISLRYGSTNKADSAAVFATNVGGGETQVASFSAVSSAATFTLSDSTDFRSFRIVSTGAMTCYEFSAVVARSFLGVPANVTAVAIDTDSLEVTWDPVEGATGYKVSIWTNKVAGASGGEEIWVDDFSKAAAGSASASAINSSIFNSSYSDTDYWECNQYIYPSTSSGVIRLGASDKSKQGALMSPHLPAGDWQLRMRAWRYSSDDGTEMPILRNSAGVTTTVAVVSFTKDAAVPEEFVVPLPTLFEGDHLVFCSFTNNKPRVILDRVALVSGYSAGTLERDVFREASSGNATSCVVDDLPENLQVFVGVTATGGHGLASEMFECGTVDLAHPPPRAMLNAFPLSSLEQNVYVQNFDLLAELTASTGDKTWLNGATLPFWQMWKGDNAVENIKYNAGAATVGGPYALSSSIGGAGRSLGGLSTQNARMEWGMSFTNDLDIVVSLSEIRYSAQQWGFRNTAEQSMMLECVVTGNLSWMNEVGGAWQECCSSTAGVYASAPDVIPVSTQVSFAPESEIKIKPGEVLTLRWSLPMPASGSSAMMAIDDLEVTFLRSARPLILRFVKADSTRRSGNCKTAECAEHTES